MMLGIAPPASQVNPWQSHTVVIRGLEQEAVGVTTYHLAFRDSSAAGAFRFRPGQFAMLYMPGVGEVPIGISGHSETDGTWSYTVRVAGNTTRGMTQLRPGDTLGLRGPFGSSWPIDGCQNADVVLVAGGMGLPPLRPVVDEILRRRQSFGRVTVIYGARTPDTLVYSGQYDAWSRGGIDVQTTVDQAHLSWTGNVGVVPLLVDRLGSLDPQRTIMMICGPEVMTDYTVRSALARGMSVEQIWTSMERNMQCAIGLCGHCQLGPEFLCKDGPVFRYDRVAAWLNVEGF
jgi:NAD(P)H-flavin reductase